MGLLFCLYCITNLLLHMKHLILLFLSAAVLSCRQEQKEKKAPVHVADQKKSQKEPELKKQVPESPCAYNNLTATLGKGLVMVNSESGNSSSAIELFNDSLLQDKYVSWNYYEQEKPENPVCPKYFNLEPDVLHFIFLKETAKSYQILNGFNEIKYLSKIKANLTTSWEDYILNSFAVGKLSDEHGKTAFEQPFRKSPSEKAALVKFPADAEMLCPLEIKGDWVKVRYDCFTNGNRESNKYEGQPCHTYIEKCKPAQTAWIKWRERNTILIDILLMP
jgi:hypothetical protein